MTFRSPRNRGLLTRSRGDVIFGVLPKNVGGGVGSQNEILIGTLLAANFNVTTDQSITLSTGQFRVTKVTVTNASISMTTAAGGLYTTTSKGGTVIVPATQVYTALTSASIILVCTLANSTNVVSPLSFSLTTGQGAAATADISIYGVAIV